MKISQAKLLDQFYTARSLAVDCARLLAPYLEQLGYDLDNATFLEPSAGDGSFVEACYKVFSSSRVVAADIDPKMSGILERDYLEDDLAGLLPHREQVIVVGNPPFGKKSSLALGFIDKSLQYSETVAFILPLQFRKFLTQKLVEPSARLVLDVDCASNSFVFNKKEYDVRSCFQVWTTRTEAKNMQNLRKLVKPSTSHPDFQMWLYNCTPEMEKVFDEDWEIAVLRQGWGAFTPIERTSDQAQELSHKNQWMLFKPSSDEVRRRLLAFDYDSLAAMNTSVKGFGKSDMVERYEQLYGSSQTRSQDLFNDEKEGD